MSYFLNFHPKALKEWKNLNHTIKLQFHKKTIRENDKVYENLKDRI
jgi:mRNA-degrading endonuclease RelE of RelBE toxin-antitoxin system